MHELSIAMSIIDVADEVAKREGEGRVLSVRLKLGALSGVVKDALLSAWELACEHTPLEGCRLMIEEVPVRGFCPRCQAETAVVSVQEICCRECGTPMAQLVSGRELEVVALEIEE